MPTAGATLRPVKGGDNMTTPLEEILKTYDTARHYNSELTPDNFASLYRLHEAGTLNIDDIIQGDKTAALIGTKQESAARAGLNKLINRIHSPNNYSCAPSGYKAVDRLLDGGFYAGLYVIGAISGLGKTTFINNVADNMAKAGRKVIYISLEMATEEIIAKSISRLTYEQATKYGRHVRTFAKDTRQILNGKLWDEYTRDEKQIIDNAIDDYKEYAGNIFIYEAPLGARGFSVYDVADIVAAHAAPDELPPVVFIDYLQIMQPPADRPNLDARRNMDIAITALKQISRDYSAPVIVISSFNRANYNEGVSFAALKESGAIEYTADVVIGLQYEGVEKIANDEHIDNEKKRLIKIKQEIAQNEIKAEKGEPQNIQVKLLKNRNGVKGSTTIYYLPKYNYFYEAKGRAAAGQDDDTKTKTPTKRY